MHSMDLHHIPRKQFEGYGLAKIRNLNKYKKFIPLWAYFLWISHIISMMLSKSQITYSQTPKNKETSNILSRHEKRVATTTHPYFGVQCVCVCILYYIVLCATSPFHPISCHPSKPDNTRGATGLRSHTSSAYKQNHIHLKAVRHRHFNIIRNCNVLRWTSKQQNLSLYLNTRKYRQTKKKKKKTVRVFN